MSLAADSHPDRSQRTLRIVIGAVLFGGTALVALHDWLGLAGPLGGFLNGPLFDAIVLSAALACLLRARRGGREAAAWWVIGLTILVQAATELCWTALYAGQTSPPYPSICDLGWLAFYPLTTLGLALMVRARARSLDWRLWADALIAALGTAALGAALIFEFVADRTGGSGLQRAVTLAYPLGDILVLSIVVGIIALSRWRPGRTWSLLLAGLAFLVFADVATTLQTADDPAAYSPGWVTPLFTLGAVAIGVEAWQRQAAPIEPADGLDEWRELMVPGVFGLMTVCLFAIQYLGKESPLTTALATATMLAVVVRLALSVVENRKLLEQVRTDPLTGLGNQGGLQVDLDNRCRGAAERPVTLALLDLNGFKRFNDTFGHPAGDRMLRQLGAALGAATDGDGSAYRIGGDEFAVIFDCHPARVEAALRRAAEALTTHGEDYAVSAAWGAAAVPEEARTPVGALQLADTRMYAQKQSRRLASEEALAAGVDPRLTGPRNREALEQSQ